ncbi:MAG: hypothetical protein ACK4TP_17410 [Hyphomicrobium sp.]
MPIPDHLTTEAITQSNERLSRIEAKLDWLIERVRDLAEENGIKLPRPPR